MQSLVDSILSLSGTPAYAIIGTLAFLEAALFVGLVLPGETALLLGGVLASQGRVDLFVLLAVAIVAAVAGDSVGYEVGRRGGPALRTSRLGRLVGEARWARADAHLARRGGAAVLVGRWVGLLRVLVPAIAGMSRMPYLRFLVYNVIGGTLWAVTVVLLGYGAGHSLPAVQAYLGRASLLLLGVLIVVVAVVLLARYASRHRPAVVSLLRRLRASRLLRAAERPIAAGLERASRRRGPLGAAAAGWTGALLVMALLAMAFAQLFDNVLDGDGVAGLDRPVLSWLADHRDDEATVAMRVVTAVAGPVVLPLLALLGAALLRRRTGSWTPVVLVTVASIGAGVITLAGKHLVGRVRPAMQYALGSESGFSFPSGHSLMSAAIIGVLAVLLGRSARAWATRVWTAGVAVSLIGLVGLSRLYLGVHWLTDVLAAWLLAAMWLAAVLLVWRHSSYWDGGEAVAEVPEPLADRPRITSAPAEP